MSLNPLLAKIPKVSFRRNGLLGVHFGVHTAIVNTCSLAFTLLLVAIPLSRFPITFGPNQKVYKCEPDFATGKVVTYSQSTSRFIRSI
jgi:hypothetical protein